MTPSVVVHWTLYSAERCLSCVERAVPNGSEWAVLYDGLPIATHVASAGRDATAWTSQIRRAWESAGWASADETPSSDLA